MDINKILASCDHTLLAVDSTWDQIKEICDDGLLYKTASICIPPCFVRQVREYSKEITICTVIGFPNGYSTKETKVFETQDAIENGADEIDMVISIGKLKEKKYDELLDEISAIKKACGSKILKVIIETCLLTDEEIIKMCSIVTEAGADFIKTSTGFSTEGATFHGVELMVKNVGEHVKVKAAGGIASLKDAEKFIELGAHRLGTSKIVKIAKSGDTKI